QVDAEQVVAAHAGLARHAGGDDADGGAVDRVVGIGAGQMGIEAVDRRGLDEIERLALGDAFGDVEQHDVAELLEADEMGERAADLAGSDQRDLGTRNRGKTSGKTREESGGRPGICLIARFRPAIQAASAAGALSTAARGRNASVTPGDVQIPQPSATIYAIPGGLNVL